MRITYLIFCIVFCNLVQGQNFVRYDINKVGHSLPMQNGAIVYNSKLYFDATDSIHGRELWVKDSLNTNPILFRDLNKIPYTGSNPREFINFNNKLFFIAEDSSNTTQIWYTDGSDTGTHQFQELHTLGGSSPLRLNVLLGKLFFVAKDDSTQCYNIWSTDGDFKGTSRVSNFRNILIHGKVKPYAFSEFKGKFFFIQYDSLTGKEMYISDGTRTGTKLFKDFCPLLDCSGLNYDYFTVFKDRLYFVATDSLAIRRLWVSDGTVSGTIPYFKRDLNIITGSGTDSLHVFGGNLYFVFSDSARVQFGYVNGTDTILRTLKYNDGSGLQDFQAFNLVNFRKRMIMAGKYIGGSSTGSNYYIFTYDSVNKNLWLAQPVICQYYLFPTSNLVYIVGDDGMGNGYELWETTGGELETLKKSPISAINKNPLDRTVRIIEYNKEIYYCANYDSSGYELWKLTYKPVIPIGLDNEIKAKKLTISPNPSTNEIFITNNTETKVEVTLINNNGQPIYSGFVPSNNHIKIDTSKFSKGVYYLVSDRFQTTKFIIN